MKFKFALAAVLCCATTYAHFGVLLPSSSIVEDEKDAKETLTFKFTHPFEGEMMNLEKPRAAEVVADGVKTSILPVLKEKKISNLTYWEANYEIKKPAVYQFYFDPVPYFEPAENKFIRHITKTVVDAYGAGEGWDEPLGLKAEIVPLARPFGLYAGNIFTGRILYKGKPAANVTVEVEYLNESNLKAPTEDHVTQEVKTNAAGEFSFAMPLAGWWGFAALIDDDETIARDGKKYPVELGAVIWVKTSDYAHK